MVIFFKKKKKLTESQELKQVRNQVGRDHKVKGGS